MDVRSPSALETSRPEVEKEGPKKPPPSRPPSKTRRFVWLLVLVALGVAIYFLWPQIEKLRPAAPPAPTGGRGRGGGGTTQVIAARAVKGDISIYFDGLGAVTPIYTVTVKSRVDGQLMSVHFTEGQIVHQGDPIIEIDPRPYQAALEQAEGNLARDQALLKNAHVDLDRYKILLQQQAIPEQTYATQEALVSQYDGTIKTDQANIDTAKLNVVYSHITSPITGIAGLRLVDPGNIVHASDTNGLVVLTQIDPISVIFTLAEDQLQPVLDKMHAGQHLRVEAWDRGNTRMLAQGTLATVDNEIDPTTGTLKLRANFDNKDQKLYPSQFVNARLLVDQKHGVTLVPNAAIQRNSNSTYAWVVKPDQTVTKVPVTLGATEGDNTEITSGLEPGEVVVMVGVDRLQEGGRVNAQVPGENPAGKQKGGSRSKKSS